MQNQRWWGSVVGTDGRIARALQGFGVGLATWFVLCFAAVALLSLSYPFHLEWMEGQVIDVVQRVVDGKPIYVEPSLEYVPFLYTPLYYYAVALVSWFTGVGFLPARLVSFASALGTGAILYVWALREGAGRRHALTGAGLFFATYPLSARWLDVSRADSLALFLTCAGLFLLFHAPGRRAAGIAGLAMAAAFFTKQSAAGIVAPVLAAWLLVDARRGLIAAGAMAAAIAAGVLSLDISSDGWFRFYAFDVPAGHPWKWHTAGRFWVQEILRPVGLAVLLALLALWQAFRRDRKRACAYAALVVGFVVSSFFMRMHSGGWFNVLMPAYAALALMAGLALAGASQGPPRFLSPIAQLLFLVQMGLLVYDPAPLIPSREDVAKGNRFLAQLAEVEGDVFMPELQFVQRRAGKRSYAFGMAAHDVFRSDLGDKEGVKRKLRNELEQALRGRKFSAIMPGRIIQLKEASGAYTPTVTLVYPQELVTGAIPFLKTRIYERAPSGAQRAPR